MPPLARRWQQRQTHACVFPCFRPRREREGWPDEWEAQPLILLDHNKSLFSLRSVWENRAPYLIAASPALSFQKQPLNPLEQGDKSFHPSPAPQNRPEIPRLNSQEKTGRTEFRGPQSSGAEERAVRKGQDTSESASWP